MRKARQRLSAIQCLGCLLFTTVSFGLPCARAGSQTINNDVFWKDVSGNPIYSQGGNILKAGNTYYWYGVRYNGAVTYYNDPSEPNGNTGFSAVTCYSSTDLVHWIFEGDVITGATDGSTWDTGWVGRLGVVFNANTGKYVLLTQYNGPKGNGIAFATSSSPTGTFTFDHVQTSIDDVVHHMSGDQSIFIDDDGTPYLIFDNKRGRTHLYVSALRASDHLHVEPAINVHNYMGPTGEGREGNAMFKYKGVYYLCSSDLHGWNASHTYCICATNITGPYSNEFVLRGTENDFSHVSQSSMFIKVQGSSGTTILYGGDRWSDFAGNGLGYNVWAPLSFDGSTPVFHSLSQFNLDAATGTWSVGSGNNYVLNPGYEADRHPQHDLAGWSTWDNVPGNANSNANGGHTGNWSARQSGPTAYSALQYQDLSVPNGTYTVKVWVKSSGGQSIARILVKNHGGSEMEYSINSSIESWTQITIPDIEVTTHHARIGVYSVANPNNWVRVDDWTFIKK